MILEDWHTHNFLCRHAIGSLEEYVEEGLKIGLDLIGFSDHFPYEFLKGIEGIPYQNYSMRLEEVNGYISNAEKLKKAYHNKIKIKIGFEIDFIEYQEGIYKKYLNKFIDKLDYILGSIHILQGKNEIFAFDDNRFLDRYNIFKSIDEFYLKYYEILLNMISSKEFDCDIISHFDLPKKYNKRPENKEIILNKAFTILEFIKKKKLAVEINTSGLRKEVKEQYPSEEIIKKMWEFDIPILLGSDAHHPYEVGYKFKETIKLIKKIGYNQLAYFDKRKKYFIDF
ncbi:MAG: histidinol-phosphatase HisJ [Candidatus Hodarchaeota archaeon]